MEGVEIKCCNCSRIINDAIKVSYAIDNFLIFDKSFFLPNISIPCMIVSDKQAYLKFIGHFPHWVEGGQIITIQLMPSFMA